MVEFQGVSKLYGRRVGGRVAALVDASFHVDAGELVVVGGPPGAGKSTLLRLACGEERPTRGTVRVDGDEVGRLGRGGLARLRRRLGVVPDPPRLVAERSAFGNVALVLRALGVPRGEIRARGLEALDAAGLATRVNALPRELSKAERCRLLLARALAPGPTLLLADEPAAGLDGADAEAVVSVIRAARTAGVTVLVATGRAGLAESLGGRPLRLAGGRIVREAVPA